MSVSFIFKLQRYLDKCNKIDREVNNQSLNDESQVISASYENRWANIYAWEWCFNDSFEFQNAWNLAQNLYVRHAKKCPRDSMPYNTKFYCHRWGLDHR